MSKIERKSKIAQIRTQLSEEFLYEDIEFDRFCGELFYGEYVKEKNYFLKIGVRTICIENFKILERDNYSINKWEENNPF